MVMKILVVDDHALIREALHGVLKKLKRDAVVLDASNCGQAMQIIASHADIGLILLDLNLPGADGVDVLRKICSIPRLSEVPVAILTSSESPSDIQRTARIGAARYIRKPSRLEDFFREVGCAVEEMLLLGGSG